MARKANRPDFEVRGPRSATKLITARFVGNAAGQPTLPDATSAGPGNGIDELTSVTWSATGQYACVLRFAYPELLYAEAYIVGATAGLRARITAIDVTAGTLSIQTEVGAVATNAATTDTIYIKLIVRNSGRN